MNTEKVSQFNQGCTPNVDPKAPGQAYQRLSIDEKSIEEIVKRVTSALPQQVSPMANYADNAIDAPVPVMSERDKKIKSFVGGLCNEVFTHFSGNVDVQNQVVQEFRLQMLEMWGTWAEQSTNQQNESNRIHQSEYESLMQAIDKHSLRA